MRNHMTKYLCPCIIISPGYDSPASQSPRSIIPRRVNKNPPNMTPWGIIPRRVSLPRVSYPVESVSPGYHTQASQSPQVIISQGVSFFKPKTWITLQNQKRKYFNPLVNGQSPRQIWIMKKWRSKISLDCPFNPLTIRIFLRFYKWLNSNECCENQKQLSCYSIPLNKGSVRPLDLKIIVRRVSGEQRIKRQNK